MSNFAFIQCISYNESDFPIEIKSLLNDNNNNKD